ncbi:hypothetical protein PV328_005301 [Microctonus aethiopoides]|uniref:Ubiquitin-like protease family profile domain-containing protein n=1 Tax=Microctonus aethiopoides TaxID=144406 RepID=A0AA39KSB7_9HYME|nr:hypothetical protein PV328_005301 [Microctonus aethiopoides]
MLNWISTLIKMLFEFLKKIFGMVDEGSRKRQLTEIDTNIISDCSSPAKRHRGNHIKMPNGKDIIEIEDDEDDDIIICDDKKFNQSQLKHRHTIAPSTSKQCSTFHCNHHTNCHHKTTSCTKHCGKKMSNFSGKSRLNSQCMSANSTKYSTLSRTYQLREKEQYSKLLQTYLPQRVQILNVNPEVRKKSSIPIETIDVESYELSKGSSGTSEAFFTPKTSTPTRWRTPLKKFPTTPIYSNDKPTDEIIKLDDTDESTPNKSQTGSSSGKKNDLSRIEKLVSRSTSLVSPTNTLRDKLSAKDVLKVDYIPRVAERYNERIEQRIKEAEELKKMTSILAKQNRLSREVALEVQLARSMRLSEAVLEEADYFQEAKLPELTPSMLKQVKNALIPRPPDQVLVQDFALRITRKDIHTLADLNWLNDEVINFYMNLLIARGGKNDFPSVYAMNTFFYPKLLSGGHASLKRWTRKVDIFAQDIVVVPIHLGMHWCMSIIDFRDKSIRYYDSMGGENIKCLVALRQYLVDEYRDKKKQSYDTKDWVLESMNDIPQQMNGSDCGVFSCTFAEYICANKKLTFTQDDMPYFRNKMVYEILNVKLL